MSAVLEQFLAQINASIFLREFSFSQNKFANSHGAELEVTDHILLLPQAIFVIEVKEREAEGSDNHISIERWFQRKILDKACGQLARAERFLRAEPNLELPNQRGHLQEFSDPSAPVVKLVIYSTGHLLPESIARQTHKISSRAGFVHLLHIHDYFHVCDLLMLPSEISSYFAFREKFLRRHPEWVHGEACLLASFVNEDTAGATLGDSARNILEAVQRDNLSLGLGRILQKFGNEVQYSEGCGSGKDYYAILREFAHMNRMHVRGIRKLLDWTLQEADKPVPELPVRMLVQPRNTGVVLFPVPQGKLHLRLNVLHKLTVLCKYDWKLPRQIGISVARECGEVLLDWAFLEHPWTENPELKQHLTEHYPFRPTPEPKGDFRFRFSSSD